MPRHQAQCLKQYTLNRKPKPKALRKTSQEDPLAAAVKSVYLAEISTADLLAFSGFLL